MFLYQKLPRSLRLVKYGKIFVPFIVLLLLINFVVYYKLNSSKPVTPKYEQVKGEIFYNAGNVKKEKVCRAGNITKLAEKKIISQRSKINILHNLPYKPSKLFEDMLFHLKRGFNHQMNFRVPLHDFVMMYLLNSTYLASEKYSMIGHYLHILQKASIEKAENAMKGSQLKLLLHLPGDLQAIFKPKWYSPDEIIDGPVYAGKDRHYGEIVAFFLSFLLNMPRVPLTVTRVVDLSTDILPVADEKLRKTFLKKDENVCFYGECLYCKPDDAVCGDKNLLEGIVTYYLSNKYKLVKVRHPWHRTYKCGKFSRWEIDNNYCGVVNQSTFYSKRENKQLLLDLIDISIFDFLIDNGDRHHYEYIEGAITRRVLLLDNGKSFGDPYMDHVDILAPLYQCCMLRKSTWVTLVRLNSGNFTKWLQFLLEETKIKLPMVQFEAMERRLLTVFASLAVCFNEKNGPHNVIVE